MPKLSDIARSNPATSPFNATDGSSAANAFNDSNAFKASTGSETVDTAIAGPLSAETAGGPTSAINSRVKQTYTGAISKAPVFDRSHQARFMTLIAGLAACVGAFGG